MNHFQYASGIAISRAAHRSNHQKVFPSLAYTSKDLTTIRVSGSIPLMERGVKSKSTFPFWSKGTVQVTLTEVDFQNIPFEEKQLIYSSQRKLFVDSTPTLGTVEATGVVT